MQPSLCRCHPIITPRSWLANSHSSTGQPDSRFRSTSSSNKSHISRTVTPPSSAHSSGRPLWQLEALPHPLLHQALSLAVQWQEPLRDKVDRPIPGHPLSFPSAKTRRSRGLVRADQTLPRPDQTRLPDCKTHDPRHRAR